MEAVGVITHTSAHTKWASEPPTQCTVPTSPQAPRQPARSLPLPPRPLLRGTREVALQPRAARRGRTTDRLRARDHGRALRSEPALRCAALQRARRGLAHHLLRCAERPAGGHRVRRPRVGPRSHEPAHRPNRRGARPRALAAATLRSRPDAPARVPRILQGPHTSRRKEGGTRKGLRRHARGFRGPWRHARRYGGQRRHTRGFEDWSAGV